MDKIAMTKVVKQLLKNPGNVYLQKAVKGIIEAKKASNVSGVYSGAKAYFKEHALDLPGSRAAHPEFNRPYADFIALTGRGEFPLHHKQLMNKITVADYGIR